MSRPKACLAASEASNPRLPCACAGHAGREVRAQGTAVSLTAVRGIADLSSPAGPSNLASTFGGATAVAPRSSPIIHAETKVVPNALRIRSTPNCCAQRQASGMPLLYVRVTVPEELATCRRFSSPASWRFSPGQRVALRAMRWSRIGSEGLAMVRARLSARIKAIRRDRPFDVASGPALLISNAPIPRE
jgi:hypothetical protein